MVALFIANVIILVASTGVIYSITSSDTSTFSISDRKISFVIDNDIDNSTKTMRIYGINNTDSLIISASDLIEANSGRIIKDKIYCSIIHHRYHYKISLRKFQRKLIFP